MTAGPNVADREIGPFWEGTAEGELRVQKCAQCGTYRWPPRGACGVCHSLGVSWVNVFGPGTLFTWTVVNRTTLPDFQSQVPYAVGIVALDEVAVRFIGRIVGSAPEALQIGMPLEPVFQSHANGVALPVWQHRQGA